MMASADYPPNTARHGYISGEQSLFKYSGTARKKTSLQPGKNQPASPTKVKCPPINTKRIQQKRQNASLAPISSASSKRQELRPPNTARDDEVAERREMRARLPGYQIYASQEHSFIAR